MAAPLSKEAQLKLEQNIVRRLMGSEIPNLISKELSAKINLPDIINQVRQSIPTPQDGKDAEVSDDMISGMVMQVLDRMSELHKIRDGKDGTPGKDGTNYEITEADYREITSRIRVPENGESPKPYELSHDDAKRISGLIPRPEDGKHGSNYVLTNSDISEIASKIRVPEDGKDGDPYALTSQDIDLIVSRIPKPLDGTNAKEIDIQEVIKQIDFSELSTVKGTEEIIKKLKHDIALGRLEFPNRSGGGGMTPAEIVSAIDRALDQESWKEPPISDENDTIYAYINGKAGVDGSRRFSVNTITGFAQLELRTAGVWEQTNLEVCAIDFKEPDVTVPYSKGRISFNKDELTHVLDTGIPGVRLNAGQEEYYLVYNNSGSVINNGEACYASGVDVINNILTIGLADNSSFVTSAQVLGLATHDIGIDSVGLVTERGIVRDFDTTVTSFGLSYLGTSGNMTNIKPLYPANRIAMGAMIKSHITEGQFQVAISNLPRRSASRSYSFTSADAASGTHYRAGFYHWGATSETLSQANLTVAWGDAGVTRAGHVGIVAQAAGLVDTGQVGLQVTGTLDSESGPQIAAQTESITDDITTLTADVLEETVGKFSGIVLFSLYVVSGAPTAYSVTLNYGFSKYEDFRNIDGTVTAFSAVWEAGAADSVFNVSLKFHNAIGWTFASSGFVPGNGDICNRLVDQAIASDLIIGEEGAYKRVNLNQFVNGSEKEGVIIEVITGANNSIRSMDLHISAFSEELF